MSNVTALQAQKQNFSLAPKDLDEAMRFADMLASSVLVPKDYVGKPGNCLVAIQWGMELGLQPMQAMQSIAVINGRPSLWGDAMLGLVKSHPAFEWIKEECDGNVATCTIKRRGEPEVTQVFSMEDAKRAGLTGKQGPWTQYPKRMLQMRARGFALRDAFPDALRGLISSEEARDTPIERDMGAAEVVETKREEPKALPAYSDADLKANIGAWSGAMQSGRTTPDRVIATISSKYTLSEAQKASIRDAAQPKDEPKPAGEAPAGDDGWLGDYDKAEAAQ
ncbi:recombinase RecT [Aromatoleum evansii]|uniref:Recombinase RecT n=1 Tax=Aromatoleum evansii TaxID=59406 RepID=A0ABZ1AQV4_AROEV|nr:recombinase RecT [Aromatoleum evansii]WRL48325.1 recombinase RecT [Aromatoleum evansii]